MSQTDPQPPPIEFPHEDDDLLYYVLYGHPKPKTRLGLAKDCFWQFLLCCLWKPCPPYLPMIIDKFAFESKKPTYYFEPKTEPVYLTDKVKEIYQIKLRPGCEVLLTESKTHPAFVKKINGYFIKPSHTKRLACRYIQSCHFPLAPNFVVFFCHANAADLGFDLNMHYYFARRMNCDFFTFDYSGYGQSSGKCNETNFYLDTTAAYEFLVNVLDVSPAKIVVIGQSLGTAAAIDLVSKNEGIKGLVLEGLFLSVARILFPTIERELSCDRFVSAKKVPLIKCPTLVIHGALDPVTHLPNIEQFFRLCPTLVPPLIIPTGEHLDLMTYRCYWNRLEIFFQHELKLGKMRFKKECSPYCMVDHSKANAPLGLMHMRLTWPFSMAPSGQTVDLETVFPNV